MSVVSLERVSEMNECRHRPACGEAATRFVCGQRTAIESAVNRGLIERVPAARLLAKYGVPITPPSNVYRGEFVSPQRKLL